MIQYNLTCYSNKTRLNIWCHSCGNCDRNTIVTSTLFIIVHDFKHQLNTLKTPWKGKSYSFKTVYVFTAVMLKWSPLTSLESCEEHMLLLCEWRPCWSTWINLTSVDLCPGWHQKLGTPLVLKSKGDTQSVHSPATFCHRGTWDHKISEGPSLFSGGLAWIL